MDHTYERGWHRYGFDNVDFSERAIHGSDVPIDIKVLFNRGVGKPHIAFGVIPPNTDSQAIGMHIHRDVPSMTDVEEWYIIIDGTGEMTFSNGDKVELNAGDLIATYPGTGHSFRTIGSEPVRLVSITPQMFTSRNSDFDEAPEKYPPHIYVEDVDLATMNPLSAHCTTCNERWVRPDDDRAASGLPVWAGSHQH